MNKKRLTILLTTFMLLFHMVLHAEEPSQEISDIVKIDAIAELKKEEGVVLEHKKHVEEYNTACIDCHHMYDPNKEDDPKPCVECHDFYEQQVIEGRRAVLIKTSLIKNIYHDKCRSCHEKLQRAGKPFPKKCSTCHPIRLTE
jgi:hypothetical protein